MFDTIRAFILGVRQFRQSITPALDADGTDEGCRLQDAYDWGREWAHRLTFRRFDEV